MRTLLLSSLALAGCTSPSPQGVAPAANVRARLAAPTHLMLAPSSTVSVTPRRLTGGGWQGSPIALELADGDVTAVANGDQLVVDELRLDFQPIDIPASVFGKPGQLTNVQLVLASPPSPAAASWSDDDDATASASLQLDLSWTIVIGGGATPLGTQHLPVMAFALVLSGDGAHVDATLAARASGAVWSWAGLLEFDDLALSLDAATID